jgi:hypothetical protein
LSSAGRIPFPHVKTETGAKFLTAIKSNSNTPEDTMHGDCGRVAVGREFEITAAKI